MAHVPLFQSRTHISPLIILDETIEKDGAVPAGLAEILAYLLLDGRRDEALAIAKLIIIGAAMTVDEVLTHVRLYPFGHIFIEEVRHALGISDPPNNVGNTPSRDSCLRNKRYSRFLLFP